MWDIVVIGGINTDYLIRGEILPVRGETVEGEVFQQGCGGKGANQAVAAARLGARVAMIGRVGPGERGEAMVENLRKQGVDTRYIIRDEHTETGAAVIMVDHAGEKQILTAPGANVKVTIYDVLKADEAIRSARVLVAQLEVPVAAVVEALEIARINNVRTVLDPAPPRPLDRSILEKINVIRPNAGEAEALTGVKVTNRETARTAADRLLRRGVQAAVVQAAEDGDLLVWEDNEVWLPRVDVETVDATGAGDAFMGALAFGLAQGKSLEDAARLANAASALSTTKIGAQAGLPTLEEVERFLQQRAA
jgi:ribokinase